MRWQTWQHEHWSFSSWAFWAWRDGQTKELKLHCIAVISIGRDDARGNKSCIVGRKTEGNERMSMKDFIGGKKYWLLKTLYHTYTSTYVQKNNFIWNLWKLGLLQHNCSPYALLYFIITLFFLPHWISCFLSFYRHLNKVYVYVWSWCLFEWVLTCILGCVSSALSYCLFTVNDLILYLFGNSRAFLSSRLIRKSFWLEGFF